MAMSNEILDLNFDEIEKITGAGNVEPPPDTPPSDNYPEILNEPPP